MSEAIHHPGVEAVWRERAKRLSRRPVFAEAQKDALPVIVLGIGKERYGIHLADVAEVLPALPVTPVPGAAAKFVGVINVHGEIRPVIDLRRLLSMADGETALPRLILLRRDGREMGLRIDFVEQIRWIGSGDMQSSGNGITGCSRHIQGSTKDLLVLLSTEALFAELQTGVTT